MYVGVTLEYEGYVCDNLPAYKAAILLCLLFTAVETFTIELLFVTARVAVDMDIYGYIHMWISELGHIIDI